MAEQDMGEGVASTNRVEVPIHLSLCSLGLSVPLLVAIALAKIGEGG